MKCFCAFVKRNPENHSRLPSWITWRPAALLGQQHHRPVKTMPKRKKLIQLNIKTTPKTGKTSDNSEKKTTRSTSSSEQSPVEGPNDTGRPTCDSVEGIGINSIHESLVEIKQNMVSKSDIGEVVKSILLELKSELVTELKTAIKDEIKNELVGELKTEIEKFKEGFEENMKRVNSANSEKFDAIHHFNKSRRLADELSPLYIDDVKRGLLGTMQ